MSRLKFQIPNVEPAWVMQSMSEVYDWGLRDLNIPAIHKKILGEGIKVCIIDSGNSQHFDTEANTIGSINFSRSHTVHDCNGHSTFCGGIVAAAKNNEGIIGVAPSSKLIFAKAMEDSGSGSPSAMARGVNWAMEQGADIISISAGMFFDFKPLHNIIKKAYAKNIIIVAAVGNTGDRHFDVAFPARYKEVIGVAAYDSNRNTANFSSRGINVSFALPGVDIYSTYLGGQYCRMNGTSFSCPIMVGICALILAKHRKTTGNTPCETPQQMMEHLQKYAKPLQSQKETGFGTIDLKSLIKEG